MPSDSTPPLFRLTEFSTRTETRGDSGLVFIDVIDSSRIETPSAPAGRAELAPPPDMLRGLRARTTLDDRGRSVSTRIQYAPMASAEEQFALRAIQPLALAGIRLSIVGLPEQAVSPGDGWTDSLRFELAAEQATPGALVTGAGVGSGSYRLERVDTRAGGRVAVVSASGEVRASGDNATTPIGATARMELSVDTGLLVGSDAELAGPMTTHMGTMPVRVRLSQRAL